jgi:hypothetical protein
MTSRVSCALCFAIAALTASGIAFTDGGRVLHAAQEARLAASPVVAASRASLLDRFLADTEQPLVSYRAIRRMSVVARGGKMVATLTARATLDPDSGFDFVVLEEAGSSMLRSRVLHGVLEAEREAKRREKGAHGALTEANYKFDPGEMTADGLLRYGIHPKRKDSLLMEGSILLTPDGADLVQMEGLLVKRPSFWTRKVQIIRHYTRIGGVRVPISTDSTSDILFAGQSSFTMHYQYEVINDVPVHVAQSSAPRR